MDGTPDSLAARLRLTGKQAEAAFERRRNVAVTAGAGSGKTRTLVARYVSLLGEGLTARQVVAITFTEKAAREMRSRARQYLRQLVLESASPAERRRWSELEAQMDSARVGTIHSLCAEILRSRPAEAGLDPQFGVLEENLAASLRAAAVQDALAWAVQQPGLETLFRCFTLGTLVRLLSALLNRRLDIGPTSFDPAGLAAELQNALNAFLNDAFASGLRAELRRTRAGGELAQVAGDGMAAQVLDLLAALDAAESALAQADPIPAALALFEARRNLMRLNVGKRTSPVKDALKDLRQRYDDLLGPWLGGAEKADPPPNPEVERLLLESVPLLGRLYAQVQAAYQASLSTQNSLDFDALEAGAVTLLAQPAVRRAWQQEVTAVLVDEFQDTNARQREIILALAGEQAGRLFIVGDARQSIYRFRGADVTVFTGLQAEIASQGGLALNLERTFRAHPALLAATAALLGPVMGLEPVPGQPFSIPFAPLVSERARPEPATRAPFIECLLGSGQNADEARPLAAAALAHRLSEMMANLEIQQWDQVALLFRASSTFPIYEQALEAAGIPFVTVAGSGFYDRPEVRDLLNMLRALADPWDDQALAGLLRSPAIGLSDPGLYHLRLPGPGGKLRALRDCLGGRLEGLSPADQAAARRGRALVGELSPLVDSLPVAELLQRLVDGCDYRATLATCAGLPGSARLWRNVDKLVSDARNSGQVRLRAFLEYVTSLRDVGARESEAASEAEGAVRLMTIHKAKGLEYPVVVLADLGRTNRPRGELLYRLGPAWTMNLDKLESAPLAYRLAGSQDALQASAEEKRLLYVGMTRAQEKLILSGHLSTSRDGSLRAAGWLDDLLQAGGVLAAVLPESAGSWKRIQLPDGAEWAVWLEPAGGPASAPAGLPAQAWPVSQETGLLASLVAAAPVPVLPGEHRRLALEPHTPPARVVGELVHKALQRWRFPGDPALVALLRSQAQGEGLLAEDLLRQAVSAAEGLLRRFQAHACYAEINAALERRHEVPYVGTDTSGTLEWGFMDCLYRTPAGWTLIDFKTDELHNEAALAAAVERYRPQLERYSQAAAQMLGQPPRAQMVFLNVERQIVVI